ncbi:flagellar basal body-associated FliL family protein [Scandinavium sp. M-37]|uniref:flagellar basal body-associated FliL family protein n=1 Tax=Scandinavium sp. M-37 TaxID=3373077 RepID=UPI0037463D8C
MSNKNKKSASGGGSRSLLTTLMFLIAITACGLAGYMFWEMKYAQPAATTGQDTALQGKPQVVSPDPLYLAMNTFTVSLKPTANESDRVLFLGISVRLADRQSLATLEKYLPEYRSRLFLLLTQQTYEGLSTDEGKAQFIASIKNELSKPLTQHQAIQPIDVLINEFILR